MCLLVLASGLHPHFDLVVAANRDELHARPTAPMEHWEGEAQILAGRDLVAGGTWLGVTDTEAFAAVTNFRDGGPARTDAPSRGVLVAGFLRSRQTPADFIDALAGKAAAFAGFSLLLARGPELWYASNRLAGFARALPAGIYGLSNELLDVPWPKVLKARAALAAWVNQGGDELAPLHTLLEDRSQASEGPQAATPQQQRAASAPFIQDSVYGTRNSTLVLRERGALHVLERRFAASGARTGETRFWLGTRTAPAGLNTD